jgi:hypothetical protein
MFSFIPPREKNSPTQLKRRDNAVHNMALQKEKTCNKCSQLIWSEKVYIGTEKENVDKNRNGSRGRNRERCTPKRLMYVRIKIPFQLARVRKKLFYCESFAVQRQLHFIANLGLISNAYYDNFFSRDFEGKNFSSKGNLGGVKNGLSSLFLCSSLARLFRRVEKSLPSPKSFLLPFRLFDGDKVFEITAREL